jgi:hypothetical protein
MANKGEENEIFLKAFLIRCFFFGKIVTDAPKEISFIEGIGFGPDVKVPIWDIKYNDLLDSKNYEELKKIFGKATVSFKADISINGTNYSVKYGNASKAAMINHTARDGFINVCNKLKIDIAPLDKMIKEYWILRNLGKISEDVTNSMLLSPFKAHKEYLKPILEYFFFKGTGKMGDSPFPADKILVFTDPFDPKTYKILNPDEAVDSVWDNLTFSLRSKKGMPIKKVEGQKLDAFSPETHPLLAPWVEYPNDDVFPKGALHVRA